MTDRPEERGAEGKAKGGFDISKISRIVVQVGERGSITLRALTFRDSHEIGNLAREVEDPREFTVRLLQHQIEAPTIDANELRSWSDSDLIELVRAWAVNHRDFAALSSGSEASVFEEFRTAAQRSDERRREMVKRFSSSPAADAVARLTASSRIAIEAAGLLRWSDLASQFESPYRSILDSLSERQRLLDSPIRNWTTVAEHARHEIEALTRSVQQLTTGVLGIYRSLEHVSLVQANIQAFYASLPDLNSFIPQWQTFQETLLIAEETGYGFAYDVIPEELLVTLRGTDSRVRAAVITNRLAAEIRGDEFVVSLQQIVQSSPLLRKRWPIVELALNAHRRREYLIAIPPMLAQVEGLFTDLMILKGEARRQGKSLIAWKRGQGAKLNKENKEIKLTGLQVKLQQSEFRNHPETEQIVDFLLNTVVKSRNDILHGRNIDYGKAKLSVQLILLFAVLAQVIEAAESNRLAL